MAGHVDLQLLLKSRMLISGGAFKAGYPLLVLYAARVVELLT